MFLNNLQKSEVFDYTYFENKKSQEHRSSVPDGGCKYKNEDTPIFFQPREDFLSSAVRPII